MVCPGEQKLCRTGEGKLMDLGSKAIQFIGPDRKELL